MNKQRHRNTFKLRYTSPDENFFQRSFAYRLEPRPPPSITKNAPKPTNLQSSSGHTGQETSPRADSQSSNQISISFAVNEVNAEKYATDDLVGVNQEEDFVEIQMGVQKMNEKMEATRNWLLHSEEVEIVEEMTIDVMEEISYLHEETTT